MRRSRPRSSSTDGKSRGSYKPSARRSTSESRNSGGMVMLQRGMSPACGGKMSIGSLFSRNRGGSLLDSKPRVSKDPRPLGDKTYQSKCIAALLEFLVANNFPYSVDAKKLMSPSKKDYERIFEFLYTYWDPKYVFTKIEDDAPKLLKMLNYPFIVIKSTFVSVNRMTWPTLLGVLMWLMELNMFGMNLDISSYFQTDFESGEERYKFLMYNLQNHSMGINDPEKDCQFFTSLITKRCTVDKSIEELESEHLVLQEKLAKLKKEEGVLKQYEKDNDVIVSNIVKYDNFLDQMKKHSEVKEQECLDLAGTLKQKETELQLLMKNTEEKEMAYKHQGYDGQQKQQFLLVQKQNLSKELEEKSERLSKEEKAYWNLEIENSTLSNKVVTMTQEFNEKYAGLKSTVTDAIIPLKNVEIPSAIKLCQSFDVDVPDFEIAQNSPMTSYSVLKGEILPALDKLKAYLVKQNDFVNDIKAVQNNCMHELEMKMSELKIKADLIKAQSVQKQREKDSNAKDFEQEISQMQEEHGAIVAALEEKQKYINSLEKQIMSLREKLAANNAKIHEARTMYGLYRTKAKELFQKIKKDAAEEKAKYDQIQAYMIQRAVNLSNLMEKEPSNK